MNNSIEQTTGDTDYTETPVALYSIFFESIYAASSVKERLTTFSSSAEEYESQKRLEKAKGVFANALYPFLPNEGFEYEINTKAEVFVRHHSGVGFEERLALGKDYESQVQLIKAERVFANEFIPFIRNEEFEYRTDTKTDALVRRYSESDFEGKLIVSSSLDKDYKDQEQLIKEERVFANELISFILNEEFEYGIDTEADALVRRYMAPNPLLTKKWINTIFEENPADVSILIGLLRVIARLDYREIYPQGQTIAVAAFSHENTEVKECGVRAFESWGTIESLKILEDLKVEIQWLQEYIDDVVSDLREEHDVLTH